MPSKRHVSIYRIPVSPEHIAARSWINLPFSSAVRSGFDVSEGSYECVFDGETENIPDTYGLLAYIRDYTEEAVPGFAGRPMGTSDIIVLDGDWYYADPHGFVLFNMPEFC